MPGWRGTPLSGLQPTRDPHWGSRKRIKTQGALDENKKETRSSRKKPLYAGSPPPALPCWSKPRVTHSKKQGKFALEAEKREVFPLGAH